LVINNRDALYDAMLDDFEPGMSNGELRPLLTELKGFLAELIRKIGISGVAVGAGVQHALQQQKGKSVFAVERQQEFCRQLVSKLGFDWARGRLDQAAHPFCSGIKFDTRLTSHYSEADPLIGIYAILHEVGHGLYVQGVADDLVGTPAGELSSMSLHESQSLLWETSVGHGFEFCEYLLHRLLEHYGQPFADLETGDLFGFVNRVNPGLIRVEADDVSYNLHIIIRWELEQELIDGELEVAKLPEAWRQRYEALLGVVPKDDRRGVLQDPHWSQGQFGYFPTYTLGSLLAAQLYASAGQALRDLKVSIKAGAFSLLAQWLRKNVHHHGLLLAPEALIRQVCGGPRSSEPFKQLVKNRLEQAYDLKL
jgi:carboxypeptidase Taq